jgi:hypothetical protein
VLHTISNPNDATAAFADGLKKKKKNEVDRARR